MWYTMNSSVSSGEATTLWCPGPDSRPPHAPRLQNRIPGVFRVGPKGMGCRSITYRIIPAAEEIGRVHEIEGALTLDHVRSLIPQTVAGAHFPGLVRPEQEDRLPDDRAQIVGQPDAVYMAFMPAAEGRHLIHREEQVLRAVARDKGMGVDRGKTEIEEGPANVTERSRRTVADGKADSLAAFGTFCGIKEVELTLVFDYLRRPEIRYSPAAGGMGASGVAPRRQVVGNPDGKTEGVVKIVAPVRGFDNGRISGSCVNDRIGIGIQIEPSCAI